MKNRKIKKYFFQEFQEKNANVRVWYGPYRACNVYQAFREMCTTKGFGDEPWRKQSRLWTFKTEE